MSHRICRTLLVGSILAAGVSAAWSEESRPKVRLGVYDNRAIAVAYAASKFNPVRQKMADYEQAKGAGDEARMRELKEWGEKHQRQLHRQGFGRVPVGDLLAHVKDNLPEVARKTGIDAIVWQCDHAGPHVEVVEITNELVQLFEPSEKTLRTVEELKKHPPADLDVIEQHHD